jgi:hypothetical protein
MEELGYEVFSTMLNQRADNNVFAKFHKKWVRTGNIKENGMPEFVEKLYIQIKIKGSTDEVDRPVDETDMMRFPREYAFFKNKEEKAKQGTPLNQFAFLTVPELDACENKGIFTVEDLSNLTEEQAKDMNLTVAKALAIKFLAMAKDNRVIAEFEEEIKNLKAENEKLKDEIKALKGE